MIEWNQSYLPTKRLLIRPAQGSDVTPLWQLVQESRTALEPWCPWARDYSLNDTQQFVDACREALRTPKPGALYYMVLEKHSMSLVGVIGLEGCCWRRRIAHLGMWFAGRVHGRGYATEAGQAFCQAMQVDWRFLFWENDTANAASERLAERLGFHKLGHKNHQTVHMKTC